MPSEPVLNVIIPTYNRATLLPQAIEAVRRQTYRNIEKLVVDDGSSDDTASVVRAIPDTPIRYIRHGIRAAAGEYIKHRQFLGEKWFNHHLADASLSYIGSRPNKLDCIRSAVFVGGCRGYSGHSNKQYSVQTLADIGSGDRRAVRTFCGGSD